MNRSQIKSFKINKIMGSMGKGVSGRVKMRYFLKQDNCRIINNQLKFDI